MNGTVWCEVRLFHLPPDGSHGLGYIIGNRGS